MTKINGFTDDLVEMVMEAEANTFFCVSISTEIISESERYTEYKVRGYTSRHTQLFAFFDADFAAKFEYDWPIIQPLGKMGFNNPEKVNALSVTLELMAEIGLPIASVWMIGIHDEEQVKEYFAGMNYKYIDSAVYLIFDEATEAIIKKKAEDLILCNPWAESEIPA